MIVATMGPNTAIGSQSLKLNTTGANNTSVGFNSLPNILTGTNNTIIGVYAGINYAGAEYIIVY